MTPRSRALVTIGGAAAAIGACALFGNSAGGMVAIAAVCFAASGPSIIGTTPVGPGAVRARDVRRYRETHPGTTISEAAAAVARR
ncbi:hypothetical protein [Curtobacterium sp. L1-20]|uniref:hypothetical protein n=1 Tax=Curtobacterium sp. L1-20 TaxID=3138181 RepID=UPI003B5171FF